MPSIDPRPIGEDCTTILFMDAAKQRECILSQEDGMRALYFKDMEGNWRFWRFASSDEIQEILAATGND